MKRGSIVLLASILAGGAVVCLPTQAALRVIGQPVKGMVNLPYRPSQADAFGNQWFIYQGGWLRQQGNMPVYSEGAMLLINGNQPQMNSNQAKLEDSGELIFENMGGQNCTITRRLFINKEEGYVRIIDVIKNTTAQEQTLNVMLRSSMNYGVTGSQNLTDPRKKDQTVGCVATDGQGRSVTEIYAGRSAKVAPQVTAQPNNNMMQATYALPVPAGKEVALMHLHSVNTSADAGQKFAAGIKESKVLQDVPKAIRKLIVNFAGSSNFVGDGDMELLRGDVFDAAELRAGDVIRGTLKDPTYKLTTFYGTIELSADKIVGMINVGESRPRQLLVTADGQVFGGRLEKETIDFELSSGQITKIPLSQITRLGYRKRANEPEDPWTTDKPMVVLRTGERIAVQMPETDIDVATRYGLLKLKPKTIAAIALQNEENGVHEIFLTDGSKFAGLVTAAMFEMNLADGKDQVVKFPGSAIARLQLNGKVDDPDDATPQLKLANDDLMVGSISGSYKLDMAFDTLALGGEQIKSLIHNKNSPLDVVVKLWDETSVTGLLQEQEVACKLKSGITLAVPMALVSEYTQPQPQPPSSMIDRIKKVVGELNADDFNTRETAKAQLVSMGTSVAGILKQLRNDQPPEGRQRIDEILATLKVGPAPAPAGGAKPDN